MISLLLTLFISLLSIGSPINTIEETRESRISTFSNNSLNLQDSKPINKLDVIEDNSYVYYSFNYFCSDDYLSYLYSQSNSGATIIPHDDYYTTMSSVFAGSGYYLYSNFTGSSGYPIKVGYFSNGRFINSPSLNLQSIAFYRSGLIHENSYVYVLKFNFGNGIYIQYDFHRYNNTGLINVTPICNLSTTAYALVFAVPNSNSYVLPIS